MSTPFDLTPGLGGNRDKPQVRTGHKGNRAGEIPVAVILNAASSWGKRGNALVPGWTGMVPAASCTGRRDDKILCLFETCANRPKGKRMMRHAVSRELYAYWNAVRAGRGAPERNDIEPGAIRGILADTFVLDLDAGRGFPLRISGSRVNALFLQELRGLSFLKLWREADRPEIRSVLDDVADRSRPYLLGAEARPPGLGLLDVEVTLLPLRHHGSIHSRMLGSLAANVAPQWLGLVGAGPASLTLRQPLDRAEPRQGFTAHSATAPRGRLLAASPESPAI